MPQILFAHVHAIAYETDAKNNQIMTKYIPNARDDYICQFMVY